MGFPALNATGSTAVLVVGAGPAGLMAAEQLSNLTQPFYRGEAARTAANGAGLGLAIVEKTVQRMGGAFSLTNATSGGLSANIRLPRVTSE